MRAVLDGQEEERRSGMCFWKWTSEAPDGLTLETVP